MSHVNFHQCCHSKRQKLALVHSQAVSMATFNSLLAFRVGVLLGGARQGDSAGFDKTRWERERERRTESLPKRDDCNCQFSIICITASLY